LPHFLHFEPLGPPPDSMGDDMVSVGLFIMFQDFCRRALPQR